MKHLATLRRSVRVKRFSLEEMLFWRNRFLKTLLMSGLPFPSHLFERLSLIPGWFVLCLSPRFFLPVGLGPERPLTLAVCPVLSQAGATSPSEVCSSPSLDVSDTSHFSFEWGCPCKKCMFCPVRFKAKPAVRLVELRVRVCVRSTQNNLSWAPGWGVCGCRRTRYR